MAEMSFWCSNHLAIVAIVAAVGGYAQWQPNNSELTLDPFMSLIFHDRHEGLRIGLLVPANGTCFRLVSDPCGSVGGGGV